jgi:hypothetical protein
MIVKTKDFELEISNGSDIYFGSKTSGQIFNKWDEFEDNVKLRLEIIQNKISKLILESEEILLEAQAPGKKLKVRREEADSIEG